MKKFYKIGGLVLSLAIFLFIPSPVVAEQKFVLKQATAINQQNHKAVILSKVNLSNWNQTKTRTVNLVSQIKVLPKKRKLMSKVTRKLNEIDRLMLRVAKLQKNLPKNKAALEKASFELKKYEKQIKGLQRELEVQVKQDKIGDYGQLGPLDMQVAMRKHDQLVQTLLNILKALHDTRQAIIRNIR